ncbi:MAG: cytochrome ubiquinol oxidase subunit I [Halanaeroarchaeum sp.]
MVDPVLASRLQFAWTIAVHIVFPTITMGLAPFLVYWTYREITGAGEIYARLRRFWTKIFAITFVTGTVTGIVLEFEFGTNWAAYASAVGGIFGGPLATEGLMAFFLESTMLGIFLFGRDRVSDRAYFASSVLVGLGSWLSAVWILIANSWMQTPRGFALRERAGATIDLAPKVPGTQVAVITDPLAAYLNPRFPWMFAHMQMAAVLSAALFIAGIAAYKLLRTDRDGAFWRKTMKVAVVAMLITAPFQAVQGDAYGRHVHETQPAKMAAIDALWETQAYAPEYLVAIPANPNDLLSPEPDEMIRIGIPAGASILASGGDPSAVLEGFEAFEHDVPPFMLVFWSFRAMVGLGFWFIFLAFWAAYRWRKGELFEDRLLLKSLVASTGLGVLALEFGWMVTEIGRQPWAIQGVLKVSEGVSPGLTGAEATLTLAGFVLGYTALFSVWGYLVYRIVRSGPDEPDSTASGAETGVTAE